MSALADHLWQSTWFAIAAAMLVLLVRQDAARIRHWVWLAASLKFLVPFAALTWIGQQFILQVEDESALLPIVQYVAEPLTRANVTIGPLSHTVQHSLLMLWLVGSASLFVRWALQWLRVYLLVSRSTPCDIEAPMTVRLSSSLSEPGVVGIWRPVLLIPHSLVSRLSPAQIDSIVAHESSHVRRHDNLTANLHSLVEILFWFHPLVWLIGAKLIKTRELACDEAAVQAGNDPKSYADAILRVCQFSVESRLGCIARATGGDLRERIRWIMSHRPQSRLYILSRVAILLALMICVALPVATGVTVIAKSQLAIAAGVRSVRVSNESGHAFFRADADSVHGRNLSMRELISYAYGVQKNEVRGSMPWLDQPRYDLDLRAKPEAPVTSQELVTELLSREFNVEIIFRSTERDKHTIQINL